MLHEALVAAEFKAVADAPEGTIEGLGAVFGNEDSHGDVIVPGAFVDTLAEYKARGRLPRMFYDHSAYREGGDRIGIGVWDSIYETSDGLYCKGRLVGLNTPDISRIHSMMLAGGIDGLSIGYRVPADGAVTGRKSTEPKRTLTKLQLLSVDVVDDPSNPRARLASVKSAGGLVDVDTAVKAMAHAMRLHRAVTAGGNSPNTEQRTEILHHMSTAHKALTGHAMPPDMKSSPETIDELRRDLQEFYGWSRAKASAVAGQGFKSEPRIEDEIVATETKASLKALSDALGGFSLSRP